MFSIAIVRRRVLRPALVMVLALGLTPGLRPIKGIDLPLDQPFPQLRRAGERLISYQPGRPGASGAVSPLDVGPVPTVRETIRSAGSAPCVDGFDGFDAVDGNDSLLTLRCGSTGFVRPSA